MAKLQRPHPMLGIGIKHYSDQGSGASLVRARDTTDCICNGMLEYMVGSVSHGQHTRASIPESKQSPLLRTLLPKPADRSFARSTATISLSCALLEGVFVCEAVGTKLETVQSWPSSLTGSRLEDLLLAQGMCPSPAVFMAPHPHGYGGEPAVISMLETALDETADPGSTFCACVDCEANGPSPPRMYCLVSKVPLFALHFEVLRLLRGGCDREGLVKRLASCGLHSQALSEGIEVADLCCGMDRLALSVPRRLPRTCAKPWCGSAPGTLDHKFAGWQAAWGLERLLAHWPDFVGEPLLQLLSHALLERKLLLHGDVSRICRVAIVLKGILWPFRWLHLFLSAPLPAASAVPLEDVPVPMIGALHKLPRLHPGASDVVCVELGGPESPSNLFGRCTHAGEKLPGGAHKMAGRQLAEARSKLQKGKITSAQAVQAIHQALAGHVANLAEVPRAFVREQLANNRFSSEEDCVRSISDPEMMMRWLNPSRSDRTFYRAFFQTQMCLELVSGDVYHQFPDHMLSEADCNNVASAEFAVKHETVSRWQRCSQCWLGSKMM